MMRRLLDIAFLLMIALGCAALDFYILKREKAGAPYALADYLAERKEDLNDLRYPPSLKSALPSDVAGWSIMPGAADIMTERAPDKRAVEAGEIALIKAVASLDKLSAPQGQMLGMTMTKGDTRLRIMAMLVAQTSETATPLAPNDTDTEAALQNLMQVMPLLAATPSFHVVDGVAFSELPAAAISNDPDLRLMRAMLTDDLAVTVVTRSSDDAAIKEAMAAIDFVMLNKMLKTPLAGVQDGRLTDLRLDPEYMTALAAGAGPMGATQADKANITASANTPDAVIAPPPVKTVLPATAVFETPPETLSGQAGKPCTRRAGVLVCPD
jgi:hypothetical protein